MVSYTSRSSPTASPRLPFSPAAFSAQRKHPRSTDGSRHVRKHQLGVPRCGHTRGIATPTIKTPGLRSRIRSRLRDAPPRASSSPAPIRGLPSSQGALTEHRPPTGTSFKVRVTRCHLPKTGPTWTSEDPALTSVRTLHGPGLGPSWNLLSRDHPATTHRHSG